MASQSSYIKHRPSLLQPSAGGGCRAPLATPLLRGHARPRARERSPALCPLPCDSLFLSDACNSQPKPGPEIFGKISPFRGFHSRPPSLSHTCAHAPLSCSSSSKLLESYAASKEASWIKYCINFCPINIFLMSST